MSRMLRFAAVAVSLVMLTGTACKKNSAPEAPAIQGPLSARPADALTYVFSSTDPDGDSVFFMISWGDGAQTQWSPATASGSDYTQAHSYSDSGTYYVKAKAKDGKDLESAWSDSIRVRVGSFPPEAPLRPSGPSRCSTGIAYSWSTKAVHPLHDSVRIQFSWGDGNIDSFGPMVASNAFFDTTHTYSVPGTYKIAARARDAIGLESPWSETLVVTVDTSSIVPPGAPTHLVLTAATDSTVNVAWSAPTDSGYTPIRYVILFQETGTTNFDRVDSTAALNYVHNPLHKTGKYRVEAVYDSSRVPSSETPSTAPRWNSVLAVPELSVTGQNTGYGWDRTSGEAFLYDMTVVDSSDKVDFYFTDFKSGFAGPNYYVASPDTAPSDPGGSVPPWSWHITEFSHLDSTATEDSALPRFITSRYKKLSLLDSLPGRLVAGYATTDNHYALLRVASIDTVNGTADIETWFQLIPGLRLIEHQ
jgi:hypothetical protein